MTHEIGFGYIRELFADNCSRVMEDKGKTAAKFCFLAHDADGNGVSYVLRIRATHL